MKKLFAILLITFMFFGAGNVFAQLGSNNQDINVTFSNYIMFTMSGVATAASGTNAGTTTGGGAATAVTFAGLILPNIIASPVTDNTTTWGYRSNNGAARKIDITAVAGGSTDFTTYNVTLTADFTLDGPSTTGAVGAQANIASNAVPAGSLVTGLGTGVATGTVVYTVGAGATANPPAAAMTKTVTYTVVP